MKEAVYFENDFYLEIPFLDDDKSFMPYVNLSFIYILLLCFVWGRRQHPVVIGLDVLLW